MSKAHAKPAGPGRPKDLEKRRAILAAAKRLFLQHGYDGISMDAIAAEAGVSKLTVYSHFTDKDTLFAAAVEASCEEQLPQAVFELGPEAGPIEEVLHAIARRFHALIFSDDALQLHRVMVAQGNPRLAQLFYAAGPRRSLAALEHLLRHADAAGVLRVPDPPRSAEHFLCLLKGLHHMRMLIGCDGQALPPPEAERHLRSVVELFVRAHAPAPRD